MGKFVAPWAGSSFYLEFLRESLKGNLSTETVTFSVGKSRRSEENRKIFAGTKNISRVVFFLHNSDGVIFFWGFSKLCYRGDFRGKNPTFLSQWSWREREYSGPKGYLFWFTKTARKTQLRARFSRDCARLQRKMSQFCDQQSLSDCFYHWFLECVKNGGSKYEKRENRPFFTTFAPLGTRRFFLF